MIASRESTIRRRLLGWFTVNKRELPWRENRDPYRIWLSEIIMQQTRVAQGTPYYIRFIKQFPTVVDLANASEQEVLRLWQGLGYYSRARNLHATAKSIVSSFDGKFPDKFKQVVDLKGIGDYTAAAILSIAYGQPYAALDGNVYRVLSRLYADDLPVNASTAKKHYQLLADNLLDQKNPGDFNEAMMEFGATICNPKNPLCEECPLQSHCLAFALGKVSELPRKEASRPVRERWFHYFFIHTPKGLYLSQRKPGDIWQGLYDLPLVEKGDASALTTKDLKAFNFPVPKKLKLLHAIRHQLSHQILLISFYEVKLAKEEKSLSEKYSFVKFDVLDDYPLPKPVERLLDITLL